MAKIIEVNLPDEYKDKNKYEIFAHLEQVATLAHNQKQHIQDLQAEIKLRDAQLQKQRGDIVKLKSMIGHQKMKIDDLKLESDTIDIEATEVKNTPNFLPNSVVFHEVEGKLPNQPLGK